jgi:hypothetical protein
VLDASHSWTATAACLPSSLAGCVKDGTEALGGDGVEGDVGEGMRGGGIAMVWLLMVSHLPSLQYSRCHAEGRRDAFVRAGRMVGPELDARCVEGDRLAQAYSIHWPGGLCGVQLPHMSGGRGLGGRCRR